MEVLYGSNIEAAIIIMLCSKEESTQIHLKIFDLFHILIYTMYISYVYLYIQTLACLEHFVRFSFLLSFLIIFTPKMSDSPKRSDIFGFLASNKA